MSKIMYMLEFQWTSYCLIIFGDTEFLQLQSFQYWDFSSLTLRCIKQRFSHHFRRLLRPKRDDLCQPCWSCGKEKVRHWTFYLFLMIYFLLLRNNLRWPLSFILLNGCCLSGGKIEVNLSPFGWFFLLGNVILWLSPFFFGCEWRWKVYDFFTLSLEAVSYGFLLSFHGCGYLRSLYIQTLINNELLQILILMDFMQFWKQFLKEESCRDFNSNSMKIWPWFHNLRSILPYFYLIYK